MSGEDEIGFQFLAENSTDIICRAGMDMAVQYASPASLAVLGWQPAELVGKRLDTLVLAEDAPAFAAALAASDTCGPGSPAVLVRMPKQGGTLAWIEIKHCLLRDAATGQSTGMVVVLRDVADRKPLVEMLSTLALTEPLTDPLTGLSTHQAFLKALERECNSASRIGSPISLLRLNFNDFRDFQAVERCGGKDSCLRRAAGAVLGALRLTDLAARYGVEDVAVILPFTDAAGATKVAEKTRSAVQLLRWSDSVDAQRSIKISVGIATATARCGGPVKIPQLLILAADHALHKAQHQKAEALGHLDADRPMPSPDWKMSMPEARRDASKPAPEC